MLSDFSAQLIRIKRTKKQTV